MAQVGVVWRCLGGGDLAVDFPCRIAFKTAHDFPFAFAFRGAFGHVVFGPSARGHADQDDLIEGRDWRCGHRLC